MLFARACAVDRDGRVEIKIGGLNIVSLRDCKYWWWFMHIISRKFMLVVNSILFRDNVTFQMAISLGFLFISFCLHITFWPFLGMKQRAEIIREEAEANLFLEIQKLEKAARVVKISGKVSSCMHIDRVPLLRFCQLFSAWLFSVLTPHRRFPSFVSRQNYTTHTPHAPRPTPIFACP